MKKDFIQQFNIKHTTIDLENPLSIGNGDFAFTCDFTGLQGFYKKYTSIPLCSMTDKIWAGSTVSLPKPYQTFIKASNQQKIQYMSDTKSPYYKPYRDDFFKFDLFKLEFLHHQQPLEMNDIHFIYQELDLYEATIETLFEYKKEKVYVKTKIPQSHCNLQIHIQTEIKDLEIRLFFLTPSSSKEGGSTETDEYRIEKDKVVRKDKYTDYSLFFQTNMERKENRFQVEPNSILLLSLDQSFTDDTDMHIYFDKAKEIDTNDEELNRRLVLSLYLMKINTLGKYPPAETGLTCNSWYGKFHLEMHLWHHLGLIRMGLYEYVLPSLNWYLTIMESSKKRAFEQGYEGLRLPKMTDYRGLDTPSNIGCFLIWQMPHLLLLLNEIYQIKKEKELLIPFFPFVSEQMKFLESFFYKKNGKYHLDSPLIPANENVESNKDTPIFELGYILYAFELFKKWVELFQLPYSLTKINDILKNAVDLPIYDNAYEAYNGCQQTYSKYNYDHPMVIALSSFIQSPLVDQKIMNHTLDKVLSSWKIDECWGWDFPMMAMTAYHLGKKDKAIELLKYPAKKNTYTKIGHNAQLNRKDLPLYLPGNGAFILAITHIFENK